MRSGLVGAMVVWAVGCMPCQGAELTPTETRWLTSAWPVVMHARSSGLPLDIVVQPQATPGDSPIALGFVDGRCKLVLSMRGNPMAEEVLLSLPKGLADAAIELITAHELGHCRRYLDGAWHHTPAGFNEAVPAGLPADLREPFAEMKATRREEGYGDLVGLAWTEQNHPHDYAALHAWLVAERSRQRIPGSHHDTLAWLRLVAGGVGPGPSMFEAAEATWKRGLAEPD
jgi:hypothetical protein